MKKIITITSIFISIFFFSQTSMAADDSAGSPATSTTSGTQSNSIGFWQTIVGGIVGYGNKDGTRPCYCSKDSIDTPSHNFIDNTLLKHAGDNIGNYKTAADCGKACYSKGYVSYVLLDNTKYADLATNMALPTNSLANIPDSYKVASNNNVAGGPQIANRLVPGQTTDNSGLIKCGRPGQNMCTLCDLIKGINDIVQFLMKISIGIALLAITIGGILYIVSSGDSGMMDKAKSAIKNALIGFIIVFSAYLIVNTTIVYLGTKTDLGISAHWGTFDCNRTVQ